MFGPCRRLDIELEMGVVVGLPNGFGEPVTVAEADAMIFGFVLLNDWSAARHPGLGVSAARPLPGQGLRHLDQPVGGHQGGTRAVPHVDARARA